MLGTKSSGIWQETSGQKTLVGRTLPKLIRQGNFWPEYFCGENITYLCGTKLDHSNDLQDGMKNALWFMKLVQQSPAKQSFTPIYHSAIFPFHEGISLVWFAPKTSNESRSRNVFENTFKLKQEWSCQIKFRTKTERGKNEARCKILYNHHWWDNND